MPTQLSLDDLFATPPKWDMRPKVDNITIPFDWERVDYLMSLESVDFPGEPEAMAQESNRQSKRRDWQYESLLEDIEEQGFLDPIFVYAPGTRWVKDNPDYEVLGNGHHRLVAAFDLGYTYVPVTRDLDEQWRNSDRD
jgi:hypothetical protein